jgi:uncharacterized protein YbaP (TraB family)
MRTRENRWRRLATLVLALLHTGAVAAQERASAGKSFIWQVERGGRISWVVGSIHVLTQDDYPLPDAMQKAFLRAATLVEEADVDELTSPETIAFLQSRMFYTNGETLATAVSKEMHEQVNDRLTRAGLPADAFQQMKPWVIALTLMAADLKRSGFDPALGVDRHFRSKATPMGKRFLTLETAVEQIEHLERIAPELQESFLREQLESADVQLAQFEAMADAWRSGDVATLERLSLDTLKDSPRVYQSFIVERTRKWVPEIEACLDTGGCFVVVGAAHVVGPDGLLAILQKRGYAITQQ